MNQLYILILSLFLLGIIGITIWLVVKHYKKEKFAPTKFTKMCIFDIDNTLTHAANAEQSGVCPGTKFLDKFPPDWPKGGGTTQTIRDSIQKCKKLGYGIAVATAESGSEFSPAEQLKFLQHLDPEINEAFVKSPNVQNSCKVIASHDDKGQLYCTNNEFADKTAMYINIMNYNDIPPSDWGNSIVFDDDMKNLTTARGLGFKVCQASPQCGGVYCPVGCGIPQHCLDIIT